jgi:GDPmannose 4,6-dehydratase
MWRMLQQPEPDDFVIATGEANTVREFAHLAFSCVGLDYRDHVVVDPTFYRPSEVDLLLGDSSKARQRLSWCPLVSLPMLVTEMVRADCEAVGFADKVKPCDSLRIV